MFGVFLLEFVRNIPEKSARLEQRFMLPCSVVVG